MSGTDSNQETPEMQKTTRISTDVLAAARRQALEEVTSPARQVEELQLQVQSKPDLVPSHLTLPNREPREPSTSTSSSASSTEGKSYKQRAQDLLKRNPGN